MALSKQGPHAFHAASTVQRTLLGDIRFRALMRDGGMGVAAARRSGGRFSKRLAGGRTIGLRRRDPRERWMSRAGWWLAQATRLIGGPLPTGRDAHVPIVVTVTEDMPQRRPDLDPALRAQQRLPAGHPLRQALRRPDRPRRICRPRRRHGAEHLRSSTSALVFRSAGYSLRDRPLRFTLPAGSRPGALTVSMPSSADGKFSFTLEVIHPRLGLLHPPDGDLPGGQAMTPSSGP